MNQFAATLRVTSIRSPGKFGGCIFTGEIVSQDGDALIPDRAIAVKADFKVISCEVNEGEYWAVSGTLETRTQVIKGFQRTETQLLADDAQLLIPSGKNLVSMLADNKKFEGIGIVAANKLWAKFGNDLYRIFESGDIDALETVIKRQYAEIAVEQWKTLEVASALQWLDSIHFPSHLGKKVAMYYGKETKAKIHEDPYRLLAFEGDWRVIDQIALTKLGVHEDDARRLAGAMEEALFRVMARGHTMAKPSELKAYLTRLFLISRPEKPTHSASHLAEVALQSGVNNGSFYKSENHYHPAGVYLMEQFLAERFGRMKQAGAVSVPEAIVEAAITKFQSAIGKVLTEEQTRAIRCVSNRQIALITGGAGVGKTTVLRAFFDVMDQIGIRVIPMAVAGRAAQRMKESTGREAYTITNFLGSNFSTDELTANDCFVIDEASMVDVCMMYSIMQKIPEGARLILVGDPVQLAPIGPGLVFHVLAQSKYAEEMKAELTAVMRSDERTGIPMTSAAIRDHVWPTIPDYATGQGDGVFFLRCGRNEIWQKVLEVYDEMDGDHADVRVLCSTRIAVQRINQLAQEKYRAHDVPVTYLDPAFGSVDTHFRQNDQIMWTQNDYVRYLMNGTLGHIVEVLSPEGNDLCVAIFDNESHRLNADELAERIELAYSITIHKSQGSQFTRVIIPVTRNKMLDQSLVYTAITRGVRQVVLVGEEIAASAAVRGPARAATRKVGFTAMWEEVCEKGVAA